MKFVLRVILAVILCVTIPMIALASSEDTNTTEFPVYGRIGNLPKPEEIRVTLSSEPIQWYADESSGWRVEMEGGPYYMINNSETRGLTVTMAAFEQVNKGEDFPDADNEHAKQVQGNLDLWLTDALEMQDTAPGNRGLAKGWKGKETFHGKVLKPEEKCSIEFTGSYDNTNAPITETLYPQYQMVFEFEFK